MLGLAVTARADSAASSIQIYASVNENGVADVTMTVRLRIEAPVDSLSFPLPLAASDIKLNDRSVTVNRSAASTLVPLDDSICESIGDHVLTFKYKISNVVGMVEDEQTKKSNLTLNLPLLSGFEYPVGSVSLTVMLPGEITGRPVFKSTYHQDDIGRILSVTVSNNMITGLITQQLKDHETLSMTMRVTKEMFSGVNTYIRVGNPEVIPMVICGLAALIYWILFLRCYPLLRLRRNSPPEGITAGEVGSRLTMAGTDLTAMVLSWAQMGYLHIQLDDRGRVWLHRKMEMGNERNPFEAKTSQTLFGRRDIIDGTGARYAAVAQKLKNLNPARKTMVSAKCGNMKIFRWLMCGVQAICGVCFAMNLTGIIAMQVILALVLCALGAVAGWMIQAGMYRIHLRWKMPVIVSLALAALWILLGIWAGQWVIGLIVSLVQLLAGLMAAYGGRRTDLGRQNAMMLLGLRRYYKTVEREELKRIQKIEPEYFFNQLPFALAMGVEMPFAKRFDKEKLPACPYFSCGVRQEMTAGEWARFLRETAEILDERQRRQELEKFAAIWLKRY